MVALRYSNVDYRSKEYFCNACGQLRVAFVDSPVRCLPCGSDKILVGLIGTLDKAKLKEEFND